jgi:L-fuculose-phosphate aldolase
MNRAHQSLVAEIARKCASAGFTASYDGNVSLKTSEGIYITATRTLKANASPDDVCLIDLNGNLLEGKRPPSTESAMHTFLYASRRDIGGIVHTHPPCATAFAAAQKPINQAVFPEVILDVGPVPLALYATPGGEEVPRSLAPFARWANAVLLANHGVVVVGETLDEAFYRTEKLEHAAKTLILAQSLGGAIPLSRTELDALFLTHQEFERRGEFAVLQDEKTSTAHREEFACKICDDKSNADFIRATAKRILKKL